MARPWSLFQHFDDEPALFAGYQRIRVDGQRESVRIIAARLGVDPAADLRPDAAVAVGSGIVMVALQTWAAGTDITGLPTLIEGTSTP